MELNRNQYFMIGLVILFLGIQLRLVQSYVLTEEATHFLAKRFGSPTAEVASSTQQFLHAPAPAKVRTITPPDWVGWAVVSIGSVLVLHSLAMRKP